jgi:hypothetical protein
VKRQDCLPGGFHLLSECLFFAFDPHCYILSSINLMLMARNHCPWISFSLWAFPCITLSHLSIHMRSSIWQLGFVGGGSPHCGYIMFTDVAFGVLSIVLVVGSFSGV